MSRGRTWRITQAQIAAGNIEEAILPVDPEQISDAEILALHGTARLRIEGITGLADIFGQPTVRTFLRRVHERWPWAGYFLRLAPLTAKSSRQQTIDLGLFMGMALCHVDDLVYLESPRAVCMRYDLSQLAAHLSEIQDRAVELGVAVGISSTAIIRRNTVISAAVVSFFDAGTAGHKPNQR